MFYNKKLDATFLHIPKCGGVYTRNNLIEHYNFDLIGRGEHINHFDFVEDEYHYNCDKDRYYHSIRSKGKYRYYLTHQNIDPIKIKNSFKFTFVRNPYEKILSAYKYLVRAFSTEIDNKRKTLENSDYLVDFNIFIKNHKNVINISYSHAFITQYDHLCEFSGNISFNYIGKTETLDDELIHILYSLGIKRQEHLLCNLEKKNVSIYSKPIYEYYNEESFHFVNNWFKNDFKTFGYTMFNTFEEFKQFYIRKEFENKEKIEITLKYKDIPFEIPSKIVLLKKNISSIIPKRIVQIVQSNKINILIYNNILSFLDKNKDYSYCCINSKIVRELIIKYFDQKTLYAFDKIKFNGKKTIFLTYIYLYLYGGIYLDIYSTITDNLDKFIDKKDEFIFIHDAETNSIMNWFIAIAPKHIIMKNLIEELVNIILQTEEKILIFNHSSLLRYVLYNYLNIHTINNIDYNNYKSGKLIDKIIYDKIISQYFLDFYVNNVNK